MPGNKVYIIGTGPGAKEYLTPAARRRIEECDLLIGAERLASLFFKPTLPLSLTGDPPPTVEAIKANKANHRIAVLVSGDPGLYSFMSIISRYLPEEDYEVIPGVSPVQLAFARLKKSWEDALIISLHGRRKDTWDTWSTRIGQYKKVAILLDPSLPPAEIARRLLDMGMGGREFVLCQNLSYDNEKIIRTTVAEAVKLPPPEGLNLIILLEKKE